MANHEVEIPNSWSPSTLKMVRANQPQPESVEAALRVLLAIAQDRPGCRTIELMCRAIARSGELELDKITRLLGRLLGPRTFTFSLAQIGPYLDKIHPSDLETVAGSFTKHPDPDIARFAGQLMSRRGSSLAETTLGVELTGDYGRSPEAAHRVWEGNIMHGPPVSYRIRRDCCGFGPPEEIAIYPVAKDQVKDAVKAINEGHGITARVVDLPPRLQRRVK